MEGDAAFVSNVLRGKIVGLKREGLLRWRVRFFDVDLGTIEVAPVTSTLGPARIQETPVSTSRIDL